MNNSMFFRKIISGVSSGNKIENQKEEMLLDFASQAERVAITKEMSISFKSKNKPFASAKTNSYSRYKKQKI